MDIPFVNISAYFERDRERILSLVTDIFSQGEFVGGGPVEDFEEAIAEKCGTQFAVGLNSGTDALCYGLRAMGIGPGDEVITPPNSFVASTAAIVACGATPVFCDVLPDQNIDPDKAEAAITSQTKAIMPVHLTGRMAKMDDLLTISDKYNLQIIEDAAQSIGSTYNGKVSGSWGQVGAFSAHPLKNLPAAGDAGYVTTDDPEIARKIKLWRNHGIEDRSKVVEWGGVSRLDVLQAAILLLRLETVDEDISQRQKNARQYQEGLSSLPLFFPQPQENSISTYHTFVVQTPQRDAMKVFLAEKNIGTAIHYPVPIHMQPAAETLGYKEGDFPVTEEQAKNILTLPVNQFMMEQDVNYVVSSIKEFFR